MDVVFVKKDGVVSMDKSFDYLCSRLRNGVYTLTIKRKVEPRTLSQNSLMWFWFACIEEQTGTPKLDVHDYYCAKFLQKDIVLNGKQIRVVQGTKDLNTFQMTNFLNKVQADAATELGINLPLPADKYFNDFITEYQHRY